MHSQSGLMIVSVSLSPQACVANLSSIKGLYSDLRVVTLRVNDSSCKSVCSGVAANILILVLNIHQLPTCRKWQLGVWLPMHQEGARRGHANDSIRHH